MEDHITDTETYRDEISTVDKQGKRLWVYPKKVDGFYYKMRTYISWILLSFLFGMPFIKINGDPILLFNIIERRFIIFGLHFAPQDFHLFVLGMLIFIIFIALFTAVFGRLFCGWVCPQTIFMEMVFRKIEYWIEGDANAQKRMNKAPWTQDKIIKKVGKQIIFFSISVLIANTFLAYLIGIDEVVKIIFEPIAQHWQGFTTMIIFSGAFYFVFSHLREQVCTSICPYGRLQSVLLDKNSIVVHYDFERGEPRGKIRKPKARRTPAITTNMAQEPILEKKKECSCTDCKSQSCKTTTALEKIAAINTIEQPLGDCIDCTLCVQVCPTGIDIRNGTQLECINCTACMDACDEVMEKIGRPKELIRYDSYNGVVAKEKKKIFTPRVIAYSVILVALLVLEGFMLGGRSDVEVLLLRTPGMLYQEVDENTLSNLYNYQIINKTTKDLPIDFRLVGPYGEIKLVGQSPISKADGVTEGALFIEYPKQRLKGRKNKMIVEVYSGDEKLNEVNTNFMGVIQ